MMFSFLSIVLAEEPQWTQEWTEWIFNEYPELQCIDTDHCVWMGGLQIELFPDQANFSIKGQVDTDSWVPLMGDIHNWPINVRLDQTYIPVVQRNNMPWVYIPKGSFALTGSIIWNQIPEMLPIPKNIGLIQIFENKPDGSRNGAKVQLPIQLDDNHHLRLQKQSQETQDYRLQVARKLTDDIPLELETCFQIQVSSHSQNIELGSLLSTEHRLHNITSLIPKWFDGTGSLWVHAPIGEHQVCVVTLLPGTLEEIAFPNTPPNWPQQEYWTFKSNPMLRTVQLGNAIAVSAEHSQIPDSWKSLPTYMVPKDTIVELKEFRRGNPSPPPNTLYLQREIWPKLNEDGFWIEDHITGTMQQNWQFKPSADIEDNFEITYAESNQHAQSIMLDDTNTPQISQRHSNVTLKIQSQTHQDNIHINGWDSDFESISTTLHLPPRWKLIYWNTLQNKSPFGMIGIAQILLLLFYGIFFQHKHPLIHKILHIIGVLAGSLCAPFITLLWQVCALGFYFKNACKHIMPLGLFFVILMTWESLKPSDFSQHNAFLHTPAVLEDIGSMNIRHQKDFSKITQYAQEQNHAYVVQMGYGTPQWQGEIIRSTWPEGVQIDEPLSIVVLKETEQNIALFFAIFCILLLGWNSYKREISMILFLCCIVPPSHAETPATMPSDIAIIADPSTHLLSTETQNILINHAKKSICTIECGDISLVEISITNQNQMTIDLEVHAINDTWIILPGPTNSWRPQKLFLDDEAFWAVSESSDHFLQARIPKGISHIQLQGPIDPITQLFWPHLPKRVNFPSENWNIEGLHSDGTIDANLLFKKEDAQNEQWESTAKLLLKRELRFDQEWRMQNTLLSQSSKAQPLNLQLPLLEGEKPILGDFTIEGENINITLRAKDSQISWTSLLSENSVYELQALSKGLLSEHWYIECAAQYLCRFEGLTPITYTSTNGAQQGFWKPLPNEKLQIQTEKLTAAQGTSYRIDQVQIHHNIGLQNIKSRSTFQIHASQNGTLTLNLPQQSTITALLIDQSPFPFTQELLIPFEIGLQNITVEWSQPNTGAIASLQFPTEFSNITVQTRHNDQTDWIYVSNFWWHHPSRLPISILFLVLCALILARNPRSNISFGSWMMGLIGFLHFGWAMGIVLLIGFLTLQNLQQNLQRKWRVLMMGFFVGMVALALLLQVTGMIDSAWFISNQAQTWYTDFWKDEIPTIHYISIPSWISSVIILLWCGWMLWNLRDFFKNLWTTQNKEVESVHS